eukprot:TRINITY_DN6915_c0_g1_i1.p1 TRINITY_DN6915_c0_g1~~TRINITY_DN6915_c0_g1_i1.p1  ORF type:complete len:170 (+),score=13.27 TRINITY_DN6915_c0_g1_i1:73-510(+)
MKNEKDRTHKHRRQTQDERKPRNYEKSAERNKSGKIFEKTDRKSFSTRNENKYDGYKEHEKKDYYHQKAKEKIIEKRLQNGEDIENLKKDGIIDKKFESNHNLSKRTNRGKKDYKRDKNEKVNETKEIVNKFKIKLGNYSAEDKK